MRQAPAGPTCADIPGNVEGALRAAGILERVKPGQTVAITAGSRGIANIAVILAAAVGAFKAVGAQPFLVPAMGSHGAGTAEGQRKVLQHLGVTEESSGCTIRSSMETAEIGTAALGFPVYLDRHASAADHILVVNRIKPHTEFDGAIESGLMKMMTIGLGKHRGAILYHQAAGRWGYEAVIRAVGRVVMAGAPVLGGLGILENSKDETAEIHALPVDRMEDGEAALLVRAKEWAPKLPFAEADILIVDQIGKDISGTGMDTKVVGRIMNVYSPNPPQPSITRIVALDLSPHTYGNAIGIGIADFTTARLAAKIDWEATRINSVTGGTPEKGRLPLVAQTEQQALDWALSTIGLVSAPRIIRINHTLATAECWASEAYLPQVRERSELTVTGGPYQLQADADGNLGLAAVGA